MTPEQQSRQNIDRLLIETGWHLFDAKKAAGVIEAKKESATLSGVEVQSSKSTRLPSIWSPRTSSASSPKSSPAIFKESKTLIFSYGRAAIEYPFAIGSVRDGL